ncbi:MAG: right-handed parallel beta-helix repeat-containing protein, partial [Planctomycetes bacterium]|nr:right-handed parallel beta-helix repeat-containing protein [Planctomycetota bacterium]
MSGIDVLVAAALFVLVCLVAEASGETWKVGDLDALSAILAEKARPGDIVEVEPGAYRLDRPSIKVLRSGTPQCPVTIRGVIREGVRPQIDAGGVNVEDGIIFFPEATHDVIVENLDLCNAAGSGNDGETFGWKSSGIRVYGKNITIRNCRSHHNENGFYAGSKADFVLVENCEIDHSGTSVAGREPYNNNFYFNAKHQMVRNCYIHHATGAENFKSRGGNTIFAFNWVEEEAAYSVEVASGNENNTLWLGNCVIKRTTR